MMQRDGRPVPYEFAVILVLGVGAHIVRPAVLGTNSPGLGRKGKSPFRAGDETSPLRFSVILDHTVGADPRVRQFFSAYAVISANMRWHFS